MTTKPPPSVRKDPDTSLERIAYGSVAGIPTVEPHDQDRLGFCVWRSLQLKRDPLDVAVHFAGARLLISEEEALMKIRAHLKTHGITA
ncbi:MAG TPA: hypothetical protein VGB89_15830 [Bacteroidota bacterium]|jgi:hypothetical protein